MKLVRGISAGLSLLLGPASFAGGPPPSLGPGIIPVEEASNLDPAPTFFDGFDREDLQLDRTKWQTRYFGVPGENFEIRREAETSGGPPNGVIDLRIDAGSTTPWGHVSHIGTEHSFAQRYGRFEIRAKFGKRPGYLPTFWLLPRSNQPGVEVDIFEHPGSNPFSVNFAAFSGPNSHSTKVTAPWRDLTEGFHTYTLDWIPERITLLIDGLAVAQSELSPQTPCYILVDNQSSKEWGSALAPPVFPEDFLVDYVKVSQYRRFLGK
jgi:hypothetical protein